jgi:serine/threonine protein kinase
MAPNCPANEIMTDAPSNSLSITCPFCGTVFWPERVPGKSCPRCLIMGESEETEPESLASAPAGWKAGLTPSRWIPPSVEWVRSRMPEFEIKALIGQGGMGAVYQARQPALDRQVAIKLLPPEVSHAGPRPALWFKDEARFLARMNHPGIVQVYDLGELEDGALYFVMEWVGSVNLAQLISSQGPLPLEQAALLLLQACAALHHAHGLGLIHRDIKPENLLLTDGGLLKIVDFGMAQAALKTDEFNRTKSTQLLAGTPDYAAPECWSPGAVIDHRADLYGLGVTFYYMLTGSLPRGNFRPLSSAGPHMAGFDALIRKVLQQDPAERYQSALTLQKDVENLLVKNLPARAAPSLWRQFLRSPRRWAAFAIAAVFLIFAGIAKMTSVSPRKTLPLAAAPPLSEGLSVTLLDFTKQVASALNTLSQANPGLPRLTPDTPLPPSERLVLRMHDGRMALSLTDMDELKALDALRGLAFHAIDFSRSSSLVNLSPVIRPGLKELNLAVCPRIDLAHLSGHQLEILDLTDHPFVDLRLIARPSIKELTLDNTGVTDLAPLANCPRLSRLSLRVTKVSDLRPIAKLPLDLLDLRESAVNDFRPLAGSPIKHIYLPDLPALDLTPLRSCPRLAAVEMGGMSYTEAELAALLAGPQPISQPR